MTYTNLDTKTCIIKSGIVDETDNTLVIAGVMAIGIAGVVAGSIILEKPTKSTKYRGKKK